MKLRQYTKKCISNYCLTFSCHKWIYLRPFVKNNLNTVKSRLISVAHIKAAPWSWLIFLGQVSTCTEMPWLWLLIISLSNNLRRSSNKCIEKMKELQSKHSYFQPFNAGLRLTDDKDGGNTVFAHVVFLLGLINESVYSPEGHFCTSNKFWRLCRNGSEYYTFHSHCKYRAGQWRLIIITIIIC